MSNLYLRGPIFMRLERQAMVTESPYGLTEDKPEGRRLSPFAALLTIGLTCLALWSAIVWAAVHVL
jgi:hypothetical protein